MLTASPQRAVGMNIESAFIILFIIAMAVAIIGQRLRLPYTVGLVLAGLLLGAVHLFPAPGRVAEWRREHPNWWWWERW
jgi:Kef-type K+ transport system membrane component KefB